MATGSYSTSRTRRANLDFHLSYDFREKKAEIFSGKKTTSRLLFTHGNPNTSNHLYAGDNIGFLRSMCEDSSVCGKVKLIYIDPPFATGAKFESAQVGNAYKDCIQGAEYLESLRQRLILLRELMSVDGSIYLHLDSNMLFPAKVILDEVFGPERFINLITRVKCNPKNQARRQFGDVCDYLLFYSKSEKFTWNQPVEVWDKISGEKEYNCVEKGSGRRFKKVPCHLPGVRNGATGTKWRGKMPPPGKHWVHPPQKLDELDREGRIYWSANGNPRRKLYLDEAAGKRRSNLWTDFRDTQNQNARVTGYPTEKNPNLLLMLIQASSNYGDLVLDAYAGSGTTLAAAGELGRRWIGIDASPTAITTSVKRIVLGTPRMGSHVRDTYIQREIDLDTVTPNMSFRLSVDEEDKALRTALKKTISDLRKTQKE